MKPQQFGSTEVHNLVEIDRLALDETGCSPVSIRKRWTKTGTGWAQTKSSPAHGGFYLSFHSYVIQTPTLNIVLDTCNGNHKQRPIMPAWHTLDLPYLDRLDAIGLQARRH